MSIFELNYSQAMNQVVRRAAGSIWFCPAVQKRQAKLHMRGAALRWRQAKAHGEAEMAQNLLDVAVAYRELVQTMVVPPILTAEAVV